MSPNLTLASTQGNNLNNLGSTCIGNATYKVSRSWVYWFWRRFFNVFTIYMHGGLIDCVDFSQTRNLYFQVNDMAQLFQNIPVDNILSFVKEINLFNKI